MSSARPKTSRRSGSLSDAITRRVWSDSVKSRDAVRSQRLLYFSAR